MICSMVMNPMLWSLQAAAPGDVTLFFALRPPPEHRAPMVRLGADLRQAHRLEGNAIGGERLHVTLANCLDGPPSLEQAIKRALAVGEALRHAAFDVCFRWSESFNGQPGRYPLVLRGDHELDALIAFRRVLRDRMRRHGFAVCSSFAPHVTLMWADRIAGPHPTAPFHWRVQDFTLIKSLVGQSRHVELGRWPLTG